MNPMFCEMGDFVFTGEADRFRFRAGLGSDAGSRTADKPIAQNKAFCVNYEDGNRIHTPQGRPAGAKPT